jgi:hypothetical protein
VVGTLCGLVVGGADATTVLPADFATIVTESVTIVRGRVTDVRPDRSGPGRTIESVVTVAVSEWVKGSPQATVSFRVPNGQVGRYRRVVVGAPELSAGEDVVVFLAGRPPALPHVFGLGQGLYRITRTDAGAVILPPTAPGSVAARTTRGDPGRRPLPVDAFLQDVRTILEGAR